MLDRPLPPLALAAAVVLLGAAVAAVGPGTGPPPEDAAPAGDGNASTAGAGGHGDHGHHLADAAAPRDGGHPDHPYANRHLLRSWPDAAGDVPTRREAEAGFDRYDRIEIRSDRDFHPANGVVSGRGTAEDPWVIEEVLVREDLYIADTSDHVVLREVYVDGQLTLNWVGDRVHLHHSHVDDLRVNENVPRVGEATAGLVEENRIEHVGQIRHYDGVFRHNTVGPAQEGPLADPLADLEPPGKAMQLDGMHGGDFHDNNVTGYVEIKLHGHHHASCFTCLRHHHANETAAALWDHTDRYHRMSFHDNRIRVPDGVALRYTDRNHGGDDGSAASEDVEELDEPHVHHTRVHLWRNTLEGGGLEVDVFNAEDRDHPEPNPGLLRIVNNTVRPDAGDDGAGEAAGDRSPPGIHVRRARDMVVAVEGNDVAYADDGSGALGGGPVAGVLLDDLEAARVAVEENRIAGADRGVEAHRFPADVRWAVVGNAFEDVETEVYWDASVAHPPERG